MIFPGSWLLFTSDASQMRGLGIGRACCIVEKRRGVFSLSLGPLPNHLTCFYTVHLIILPSLLPFQHYLSSQIILNNFGSL